MEFDDAAETACEILIVRSGADSLSAVRATAAILRSQPERTTVLTTSAATPAARPGAPPPPGSGLAQGWPGPRRRAAEDGPARVAGSTHDGARAITCLRLWGGQADGDDHRRSER
ncbi:hypothetical protein F4558_001354 [Micromonospora profundi]|nr:hypothetical protein [Micromonospora profundi]